MYFCGPADKAMAMGVIQFAIGVFGNVPCPIVFGAAVDAACRLRDAACGVLGGCASYDSDSFRRLYLGERARARARARSYGFRGNGSVTRTR